MKDGTHILMPGTIRQLLSIVDKNIEKYLLIITYFYITFIIVMGVFNRFILHSSSGWEQETARLLFIWLTWIGASLALRKRSHIRIGFIYDYVSERVEGLLYIVSDLAIIFFCVTAFDAFVPVMETTYNMGSSLVTLNINKVFFEAAVPVGLILLTIRGVQMLILDIQAVWRDEEVYQGEPLFGAHQEKEEV